jgi:hypothetical protein
MKHDCYIGFYDISKLQGFWGTIIKTVSFSKVTHIAPIIKTKDDYITVVLLNGGKMRISKVSNFQKLEVKLLDCCYVGAIDTSVEQILEDCEKYTQVSTWSVFWWFFFTRYFTNKYPKVCTTYTCDLFKLKYTDTLTRVIPAKLYRRLKNDCNYVRWESPCWEDNSSKHT